MHEYIFNHTSGNITIFAEHITQAYQEFDNFLRMHRIEEISVETVETPQIISSNDPDFTNFK